MTNEEMTEALAEHLKGHARMFTPGNNFVLAENNRTPEMIASWIVTFLEEKNIKF